MSLASIFTIQTSTIQRTFQKKRNSKTIADIMLIAKANNNTQLVLNYLHKLIYETCKKNYLKNSYIEFMNTTFSNTFESFWISKSLFRIYKNFYILITVQAITVKLINGDFSITYTLILASLIIKRCLNYTQFIVYALFKYRLQ